MKSYSAKVSLAVLAALGSSFFVASSSEAAVVINEVYGGGGNSGSTYTNDFIELYNNGPAMDISGYQLNYGSATGTAAFNAAGTDNQYASIIPAGTTLAAGGFYLIQEAAGTGGTTPLPSPNLVDSTAIAMAGSAFKVQLIDSTGAQLDLVGVGSTANLYEGTGPAPGIANATSSQRKIDGVDTNDNSADFFTSAPTPGATNAVPEPASLGLAGLAIAGLVGRRRRANA